MAVVERELSHCEQCGAPLDGKSANFGCLNCLLIGGLASIDSESRRFQHYEICLREGGHGLDELGRGAMGVTYRALDLNLEACVALKIIGAAYSEDAAARERFRREARSAAQLRHQNVASVFHFGETPAGQCFYAMELVEGETLEALVQRGGPLPAGTALDVVTQVARALLAAEAHGLIHRDLKPSNLMVLGGGAVSTEPLIVKVIDFGLAKAAAAATEAGRAALTFSGTPGFASPEQLKSADGALDARSDIYSLGATLHYLLSGSAPSESALRAPKLPPSVSELLRFMLAADPARRPQSARALLDALQRCRLALEAAPRRRKLLKLAALALVLVLGAVGLTSYFLQRQPISAAAEAREKSIAVLPLENLSDDKENAYFADGIQDDILTSLARIGELKVISRTSVAQYRGANVARNLRGIARELGVENILEGSVRRDGNRVLINVQLIDARNDRHIWAERYDRTLIDSIGLQGELATQIAVALQARLAPEEKARLETKSTGDPAAYALYLRALGRERAVNRSVEDATATEHLYAEAIALDPKFALAYARLSIVNSHLALEPSDNRPLRAKARVAADEARRLSPSLGEAHTALGLCLYWGDKDYAAALKEFSVAATTSPNEPDILHYMAGIYRRLGRWRESLASDERAEELDPRNAQLIEQAALNHMLVRDWPRAAVRYHRALDLAPDSAQAWIGLAYLEVFQNNNPAAGRKILENVPAGIDPDGLVTSARWDLAMAERDYASAEKILSDFPLGDFPRAGDAPKVLYLGRTALARGEVEAAKRYFAAAVPDMEGWVRDEPGDANRHAQLGLLYAYMQRKEDALREGLRAVELEPENQNAFDGANMAAYLALIHTLLDEQEQSITLIERLLSIPGPFGWPDFPQNMTLADLRLRWEWDSLRSNPRFQKILAGPEPQTVF